MKELSTHYRNSQHFYNSSHKSTEVSSNNFALYIYLHQAFQLDFARNSSIWRYLLEFEKKRILVLEKICPIGKIDPEKIEF